MDTDTQTRLAALEQRVEELETLFRNATEMIDRSQRIFSRHPLFSPFMKMLGK